VGSLREPVQSRAHKTRAALLRAAASEFNERGYTQTTTKTIAEAAQVAAGSFYQYFPDKDAVLRELAAARQAQLQARLDAIGLPAVTEPLSAASVERLSRPALRSTLAEVIGYHRGEPGLHAVLTERRSADPELDAMTGKSEQGFVDRLEVALAHFGFAGDRRATAFVLFGMIEGAVHSHVLGTRVVSDKRFVDALAGAIVAVVVSGLPQ
jgi:AcrR family transcriptional regulator